MVDPAFYDGDWQPVMDRYSELQSMLGASGGGNVANIAKAILERLGLDQHPMEMKVSSLSGGERAKLALARQLVGLAGVDVIFLDEPTNHLDMETIYALAEAVNSFNGGVIVVSHDQHFMNMCLKETYEIRNKALVKLAGGLEDYKKKVLKDMMGKKKR